MTSMIYSLDVKHDIPVKMFYLWKIWQNKKYPPIFVGKALDFNNCVYVYSAIRGGWIRTHFRSKY